MIRQQACTCGPLYLRHAEKKSTLLPYLESHAVDRSENEWWRRLGAYSGNLDVGRAATGSLSRHATSPAYARLLDELLPAACHVTEQYRNNPIEADYGA